MSWAEAKWGSDRTIEAITKDIIVGSDTVNQVLINTLQQKASSSGYQISVGSFVASVTGIITISAKLRSFDASSTAQLTITNAQRESRTQSSLSTDSATVTYLNTTSTSETTVSGKIRVVAGTRYYMYLGSNANGSSAYAYCSEAHLGWATEKVLIRSARECGVLTGIRPNNTSGVSKIVEFNGTGFARIFMSTGGSSNYTETIQLVIDGMTYSASDTSIDKVWGMSAELYPAVVSSPPSLSDVPYIDVYFKESFVFNRGGYKTSEATNYFRIFYDYLPKG